MTRKTKMTRTGITLTLLAVALSGCAGAGKATKAESAAAAAAAGLSGKVVETMDAGGYTYINLEKDGKKTWVAVPVTKVAVGQELNLLPGAEMTQFASKSLNRTFEKIIFSGGVAQNAATAQPSNEVDPKESATPILVGKVVETMDAAQYTYICLEKEGKRSWAAVPATAVKVGDEIELLPGTAMGKFTSKRLNRTFNAIYFAGGVKGGTEKAAAKEGHPAADSAAQLPAGHPKMDAAAGQASAPAADPAAAQLPAGHPKMDAAAAQPAAQTPAPAARKTLTGKVVETMDAGGYSYISLEQDGKKVWVAVPAMKVAVGEQLSLPQGVVMTNFVSKSLNRTFENIIFTDGPQR